MTKTILLSVLIFGSRLGTSDLAAQDRLLPPVATATPHGLPPPLAAGIVRVPVVFSGGHATLPIDHGRPVVLIAAALGVKDQVFRDAFSHVHPAGPGSGGPTDDEARANKHALMQALAKYGITNERLNTVSTFYRYASWKGQIWKNRPATANALVKDGVVVGFEVTNGGYGYTSPPTVSVPNVTGGTAQTKVAFGKDLTANGAISEIILLPRL